MIIGMLWMIIMKLFAGCITWSAILILVASCGLGTYYVYTLADERQKEIDAILDGDQPYNY